MRKPDGIEAGMVHAMGWEKFQRPDNQYLFTLPEITVKELAQQVSQRLNSPVVRVVGDPGMKVTKIGFSPGSAGSEREIHASSRMTCRCCWSAKRANGRPSSMRPTP